MWFWKKKKPVLSVILNDNAYMPTRAHDSDAGADLRTPEGFLLKAHNSYSFDTGVGVQIPKGYFGKLESKSGLNVKAEIICPGGVIDSGYIGTIVVRLKNDSDRDYYFKTGDKVCQIVIIPCMLCDFKRVTKFKNTERGSKGFGSTGR